MSRPWLAFPPEDDSPYKPGQAGASPQHGTGRRKGILCMFAWNELTLVLSYKSFKRTSQADAGANELLHSSLELNSRKKEVSHKPKRNVP